MDSKPTVLVEKEAAKFISHAMRTDTKPWTLGKWRQRKKGPPFLKVGGVIRYRLQDLQEWIERCRVVPSK
jgi:hypothetical protein